HELSKHVRAWSTAWPGRCAVFWRTLHNTSEAVPCAAWSISSWNALYDVGRAAALGALDQALEVALCPKLRFLRGSAPTSSCARARASSRSTSIRWTVT